MSCETSGYQRAGFPIEHLGNSFLSILYRTLDYTEARNVRLSFLGNANHASADDEPGEKELRGLELDARYFLIIYFLNFFSFP